MRIAQVSPLYESVPPQCYGGTERVVSYLTEELVEVGHDVTLFASGESTTSAQLVACCPRPLRTDPTCRDPLAHHMILLEHVFDRAAEFDIIHFHIDYLHFPYSRRCQTPHITTLHGRLDLPDLPYLYSEYDDVPLVSISDSQRAPLPWVNWQGTVYHGLPSHAYEFRSTPGDYLAFLGRLSPEKGADRAISIARQVGMPIRIAAKVDPVDAAYFHRTIEPLLKGTDVEFLGEINDYEKRDFLGNAHALLFPIDWPEPFGLVMIEALACGTPVVAYAHGSAPEVIDDGITGFLCKDADEAQEAVHKVGTLSRQRCRETFEERFSAQRMAADYVDLYQRLMRNETERIVQRADRFSVWNADI